MPVLRSLINERDTARRETFVPLHTTDLINFLSQHPRLHGSDSSDFRHLAGLILSLLHHVYRQRHEQLTYLYAPLDPDRDSLQLSVPIAEHRETICEAFSTRLRDVLRRANYRQLSEIEIQQAVTLSTHWGVKMRVDFAALRQIEVYVRGHTIGQKALRHWRHFFRRRSLEIGLHQRLVIIFRTCGNDRDDRFDPRRLYLRMFKNIPQQDVDMVLPASSLRLSFWDHSHILVPTVYTVVITLMRLLRYVVLLTLIGLLKTVALIVLFVFALLYGVKSMFTSTLHARRRYHLNIAQNLYYQNLDNNAGAVLRLLEEGEQQEACQAVLAYFTAAVMFSPEDKPTLAELGAQCEQLLREATGIQISFHITEAVRDLVQLGIMRASDNGWQAVSIIEATRRLAATWDQWFNEPHTKSSGPTPN